MYSPSMKLDNIIQCNDCKWFLGNYDFKIDGDMCPNCEKTFTKTKSIIDNVVEICNGKIITESGKKI